MGKRGRPAGAIPQGVCPVIAPEAFLEVMRVVFRYAAPSERGGGVRAAELLAIPRSLLYRYRTRAPLYITPQFAANLNHFHVVAGGAWPAEARIHFQQVLLPSAVDLSEMGDTAPTGTAIPAPARDPHDIDSLIGADAARARRTRGGGHQAAISAESLRVLIRAGDVICDLDDVPLVQRRLEKERGRAGVFMFVFPCDDRALLNFVPSRRRPHGAH